MAEGLSTTEADSLLDVIDDTAFYVQLHTAAPGAAGTTAVATNTTRKLVSFAAASGGSKANSVEVLWSNVPATETYTHCTAWSASTAGTFRASGTVASGAVTAGDDARFAVGALVLSFTVAS